ncbi:hypothetical protein GJU92_03750 [Brucella sp. 10RB9213]|nr:hypothetical protein [Brucella sp. 10RB9213]
MEPLYLFVFTHYPTHRSGIGNQSGGLISPRRRFALLARKYSRHKLDKAVTRPRCPCLPDRQAHSDHPAQSRSQDREN